MIRIVSGKLKGRKIPFDTEKFKADITMQMVKEAFFSIIASVDRKERFLDLFSCSGQMGLEAYSRGFSQVDLVESDRFRSDRIRKTLNQFDVEKMIHLHSCDVFSFISRSSSSHTHYDVIFADPPYDKKNDSGINERLLLSEISDLLQPDSLFILQHYYKNIISGNEKLCLIEQRKYGTNMLSFFRKCEEG